MTVEARERHPGDRPRRRGRGALSAPEARGGSRLAAIRAALAADPTLTVGEVAARQGITPRHVQMLFEETGSSVSGHVLALGLDAVRRMLRGPRHAGWSIGAIAFGAGFGDLSSFNRQFRRRFGMTPS